MGGVRYTPDVRDADTCFMWWISRAAATAAVLGAALVTASLHGHGSAPVAALPAALHAPQTYQPPKVALPAPAAHVRILPRLATRPEVKATPRTTTHAKPKPAPARAPAPKAKPHAVHHVAARTSYSSALNSAVARIPTYRAGTVRWVVSRAYAFWGTADWYHGVLYVSPDVPRSKLYDVAVHEWSHELSVLDYAGDVAAATRAMNAWFGGSGLVGPERAADCMSILQGATWTHYTTCTNAHWRAGARLLVAGQPL